MQWGWNLGWWKQVRGMSLGPGHEACRQVTPGVLPQPITWAQLRTPPCRRESTICQCCDMTCISGLGPRNPDEREDRAIYSCRRLPIALGGDRIMVHRGAFSTDKLKWWAQISHLPPHFPDIPEPCLINQISLTGPCRPHRAPRDCPLTSLCSYHPAASCVLPRSLLLFHCPRSSFPNRHKSLGSRLRHCSLWRAFLDRDPNVSPTSMHSTCLMDFCLPPQEASSMQNGAFPAQMEVLWAHSGLSTSIWWGAN